MRLNFIIRQVHRPLDKMLRVHLYFSLENMDALGPQHHRHYQVALKIRLMFTIALLKQSRRTGLSNSSRYQSSLNTTTAAADEGQRLLLPNSLAHSVLGEVDDGTETVDCANRFLH